MRLIVLILVALIFPLSAVAAHPNWQNVCSNDSVSYCRNVGKIAYNNFTNPLLARDVKLGKIIGVSWRPKGSLTGVSEAIPSAGIPKSIRTSPRNAYYYIIDDGGGKPFLRQCREIDAKPM
jgi:hypothetical protein